MLLFYVVDRKRGSLSLYMSVQILVLEFAKIMMTIRRQAECSKREYAMLCLIGIRLAQLSSDGATFGSLW